ncbi:hypothetical protein ABPG72_005101 [Tetrahymena utriculariae]
MSYELAGPQAVQDMIEDQVYHIHIAGSEMQQQQDPNLLLHQDDLHQQHHHRVNAHDFQQEQEQKIANQLIQQQHLLAQHEEQISANQTMNFTENYENINYELALKLFKQMPQTQLDANSLTILKQQEDGLKIFSQLDALEKEITKKKNEQEYQLKRIEQNQLKASQQGALITSVSHNNNTMTNQANLLENRSLVNSYVLQNSSQIENYGILSGKNTQKSYNKDLYYGSSQSQNQFSEGKYGIAASLRNQSLGSPNNAYNTKKEVLNFNTREELKCTFHPTINKKSEKIVKRGQGDKDYSVKYLYQDFLQRQEKERLKKEQEIQTLKAQMTKSKIDPKSQKIILKKIDKVLSFIINQVQEGDYISYENLGYIYQEIGLFRALQFQKDQNQTSLYLNDRKNIDMNRMQQEMKFHEQSYRILNLNNAESGVPKKLAFDVLMVLIEKKILNPQAEVYIKEILINGLQINQASTNQEERLLILQQLLQESNVPQESLSHGESWDIPQLVANFRKLHDDKTNLMEWYSSKNNNILNDIKFISDQSNFVDATNEHTQNNLDTNGKSKKLRNSMTNAELKFHPVINKKSKILDSCLMMSQSGTYFTKAQTAKNAASLNPIDNFSSELSLSQKSGKKQDNQKKRYEILYEHSKYLEQKKKEQKEIVEKEQNNKCTFKPIVNQKNFTQQQSKVFIDGQSQQQGDIKKPVYEKLYEKHLTKEEELNDARLKVREQRDLKDKQECTFRPNINYNMPIVKTPEEQEKLLNIKGTQQILDRLQKARNQQVEKESFFERQRQALSQNVSRFTEARPFSFDQQNSLNRLGNQSMRKEREIIGNVDVNFSKGKKGRIIIYKGDNPEDLALNFAKIYSLNDDMRFTLKEMIAEYIQKMENEATSSEDENRQNRQGLNQAKKNELNNDEDQEDQGISNKSVRGEEYEEGNGTSAIDSIDNNNQIQSKENTSDQGEVANAEQIKEIVQILVGESQNNQENKE